MVVQLDEELARVRRLFVAEHLGFVMDAMVAGNSPASVWVDSSAAPRSALVWDGAHCVYLAGVVDDPAAWREVYDREIAGAGLVKLYASGDVAERVFAGMPLLPRERVLYRTRGEALPHWRPRFPAGFLLSAINDRFADPTPLRDFAHVVEEIESCWNSVADFRRAGFGFAAHDAEQVVCWCTAEYVSDERCGIGIETLPAHQGRGFATATAAAFVEACARRRLTAHWDAWSDNLPSRKVAEKLGFGLIEAYSVFVIPDP